jgi:hypothetical protein
MNPNPPRRPRPTTCLGVLAAALALAGCYGSQALLLDPALAIHPLADGVYAQAGDGGARLRLTLEPDGWYAVERLDAQGLLGETHRVLVNSLGGDFVLAEDGDDGFSYAVARIEGAQLYLAAPDCADPLDRDDAEDQGASLDEGPSNLCRFTTREALTAALTAFEGHADFGAAFQRK